MKKQTIFIMLFISIILIGCNEGTNEPTNSTEPDEETTEQTTPEQDTDDETQDDVNDIIDDGRFHNLTANIAGATSIAIGLEDEETSHQNYTLIKINQNDEREKVVFTDPFGQRVTITEKPYLVEVMGNYSFVVYIKDTDLTLEPTLVDFRKQHYKNNHEPSNIYFAMLTEYYNNSNFNFVAIHNDTGTVVSLSMMARVSIAEALKNPPVDENPEDSLSSASLIRYSDLAYEYYVQDDTIYIVSNNPIYSDITTVTLNPETEELVMNTYKNDDDSFLTHTLFKDDFIVVKNDYELYTLSTDFSSVNAIDLNLCSIYTIDPCKEDKITQQSFKIWGVQPLNDHLYINISSDFEAAIIVLDKEYNIINSKLYFPGDLGTPYLDFFTSYDSLYFLDDQSYLMELNPETLAIEEAHKISKSWQGSIYHHRTDDHMYFFSENDILRYNFTTHEMDTIGTMTDFTDEYIECLIVVTSGEPAVYQNFYFETGEFITKEMDEHLARTIRDIEPLN
ncbi:hypothetical protein [Haloplasma contractile]|uniref:Membrane lipoprotein n=1 Tax=Haloplasma contractile SSD-17B TaxID=1033810 RepID=U2FG50_9MOLU|nr:hypothetical protein [Haloplasma contractile]ERJ11870.1 membrane lipoprotein [Haloplasma contractile SSD-17B]